MITVNIHEAKTHLSRLLKRVALGEEVIIAKAGKPLARIVRFKEKPKSRTPGQDRRMFEVPEDFDAPLPADIIKQFES
jgi:prevent-host-death family protein